MNAPQLSVVIPNWNGRHFLDDCLQSLQQQSLQALEVLVVDNASQDGSQRHIQEHYPEVRLIELPENAGFTGACNRGLVEARAPFVALLNNDTELNSRWAEEVLRTFSLDADIGIVASKMMLFHQRDHFHTAGDYFTTDGRAGNRGAWQRDTGQYDRAQPVFAVCGGAAAYRHSMLDDIGLLDDDFFFLLEDVDISWRAQLAGYKVWYAPTAIVYHHLSATGGDITASYYDGRNGIWLIVKNMPGSLLQKYWRPILQRQAALAWAALKAWRGAAARARLRGMASAMLGLRGAWRKRHRIQASKRVSDSSIDRQLTAP